MAVRASRAFHLHMQCVCVACSRWSWCAACLACPEVGSLLLSRTNLWTSRVCRAPRPDAGLTQTPWHHLSPSLWRLMARSLWASSLSAALKACTSLSEVSTCWFAPLTSMLNPLWMAELPANCLVRQGQSHWAELRLQPLFAVLTLNKRKGFQLLLQWLVQVSRLLNLLREILLALLQLHLANFSTPKPSRVKHLLALLFAASAAAS